MVQFNESLWMRLIELVKTGLTDSIKDFVTKLSAFHASMKGHTLQRVRTSQVSQESLSIAPSVIPMTFPATTEQDEIP